MNTRMTRHPISACVNCRDDESTIRRWLDVFAPRVKEVIICDTGSKDRTLEIINLAPYENIITYNTSWPGFVKARNHFFELASQPFIIQVDADEFLFDSFFDHIPEYIKHLTNDYHSIRLPHYWAKFNYTSISDATERTKQFDNNYKPWSYPRDVMYRRDLTEINIFWIDDNGAEILNNLNTQNYLLAKDPLIHCVPARHKLNNDEYHARKMLAYARDIGYIANEWTEFMKRFSPSIIEQMKIDTDINPADPAPHATWWGDIGHLKAKKDNTTHDNLINTKPRNDIEQFITMHISKSTQGLTIARLVADKYKLPLAYACKVIIEYEQAIKKGLDNSLRNTLSEFIPNNIENIVFLNSPLNISLPSITTNFIDASIINVSNFHNNNSNANKSSLTSYKPVPNNILTIEADSKFTGLAWHNPLVHTHIDLLIMIADPDYETVCDNFNAWEPHISAGGAMLFEQIKTLPDSVGIFFSELNGNKQYISENTGIWIKGESTIPEIDTSNKYKLLQFKHRLMDSHNMAEELSVSEKYDAFEGNYRWPAIAETMIGCIRMEALQHCIENVLRDRIPGDFIEAGVWRGGASIFMRAILDTYRDVDRTVWLADSYNGLPEPNTEKYPADEGLNLQDIPELSVSLEQVQDNFKKYQLLDSQVSFIKGWFKDTLKDLPVENFAILRLDGDLYESTMDALSNLYHKLSPGGYVIVDDYWAIPACRQAVDDFRREHNINEPIERIDWTGVQWRRENND